MGSSRWDAEDWRRSSAAIAGKSTADVFASRGMKPELNPFGLALRESRDSDANPASTAIVVGLDVTGSMGMIADALARNGLGTMVEEILARKPVSDPHIMACGIGDAYCDRAPLQVTQFEADIRIADQLKMIWLEKGGGGNSHEGYHLPWYFAAAHTSIDCFEKRGKKGYLFTVGDEEPPEELPATHIERVFGETVHRDFSTRELLTMASRTYNIFHIIVEEGSYARSHMHRVVDKWTDLLGQNVLRLADHTRLAEVVVSAIEVSEGRDRDSVARSWKGDASRVVSRAISSLPALVSGKSGVMRF